jgi:two-component system response regulator TctD
VAELLARIRTLLRRNYELVNSSLIIGTIRVDINARMLPLGNEPANLTPREFSLLKFLF